MKKKQQITLPKQTERMTGAMRDFLTLLYHVSISPGILEFCTPGHRAGRGFDPPQETTRDEKVA